MKPNELHNLASATTPQGVGIPQSYAGLIVWALGKWGAGAVFLFLLMPVYQDLKESNKRIAEISVANVEVLRALATKVDQGTTSIIRLEDAVRELQGKGN